MTIEVSDVVRGLFMVVGVYATTFKAVDVAEWAIKKLRARYTKKPPAKFQAVMTDDEADDAWIESAIITGSTLGFMPPDRLRRLQQRGLICVDIGLTFKGAMYYSEKVQ